MLADVLLQECILKVVVEKTPSSSGIDLTPKLGRF
jgi:hypothetical protein